MRCLSGWTRSTHYRPWPGESRGGWKVARVVGRRSAFRRPTVPTISAWHNNKAPRAGATDFSVLIAFRTTSNQLQGGQGAWFRNTGLVDSSNLGLAEDWGVSLNQAGQISAGLGAGPGAPPASVYSTAAGLNDGQLHVALLSRAGSAVSLYVDQQPPVARTDASPRPRSTEIDVRFGTLQIGTMPYNGDISEIRFYRGAATSLEATQLIDAVHAYFANQRPWLKMMSICWTKMRWRFMWPRRKGS